MKISENIFKEYILTKYEFVIDKIHSVEVTSEKFNLVIDNKFTSKYIKGIKLIWNGSRTLHTDNSRFYVCDSIDYFSYDDYVIWQRNYKLDKLI